jgi:RimJ/RimL family protein N-acetyltransferase
LSPAPALETERLLLRGHTHLDFDHCLSLWGDAEVTRFIGGRPASGEEVWARLLRYVGHWHELGYGFWTVSERASGRFVGELGFADFHRAINPPLTGMPEMGWALMPWTHGRGYATEAITAALAWGAGVFTRPACCIISPDNAPSIRVAEKTGFKALVHTSYHDSPTIIFRRDWV